MQEKENAENNRILLIDDNPSIHDDFKKILLSDSAGDGLREAEEIFFGETSEDPFKLDFVLDSAHQGADGYEMAKQAVAEGKPYAMAFVDMRMPPGWDGLTTIEKLWEADPHLQVVICSAYSDHSWPDICSRLGQTDQLLILKKPFDNAEVSQLALAFTKKWNLGKRARMTTQELKTIVADQTTQIKEQDRELRHKQKLEAIGSLAGGVAHEFNNLLQVIHGLTTIAMEDLPAENPTHENLVGVVEAANRATGITRNLLSFSRRRPMQKLVFEVNEIVAATIQMVNPLLGKRIEVRSQLVDNAGHVLANGDLISQSLLNLCVDARDAMDKGGEICISTEKVEVIDGQSKYNVPIELQSGPYCVVSVSDNGQGIPEDQMERIFDPFFTTKDVGKGTGMGLSMVFGAVQEHGGGVTVESEVGQGTTFRVFLPFVDINDESLSEKLEIDDQESEELYPSGNEILLVLASEAQTLQANATLLANAGYDVFECSSIEEAEQTFQDLGGNVNGWVVDMNGDTETVLARLSQLDYDVPSVVFQAPQLDTNGFELEPSVPGQITRLNKPVSRADLLQAVRELLDAKEQPTPTI